MQGIRRLGCSTHDLPQAAGRAVCRVDINMGVLGIQMEIKDTKERAVLGVREEEAHGSTPCRVLPLYPCKSEHRPGLHCSLPMLYPLPVD